MDRRQFLVRGALAGAGTMLPLQKLAALHAARLPMERFVTLRRNVGYFTERGGTIGWLANGEALAAVDSQYPESARTFLDGFQEEYGGALDLLVNTHHHGDHTAGNAALREAARTIAAHENVPGLMRQAAGEEEPPPVPDTTYAQSWQTDLGDETLHLRYFGRGHTSGDSVVYFEQANVVHMGDLVFNRMNPYADRTAGASIHNWITILDVVRECYPSDAIFVFGHGKPDFGVEGDRDDVAVMRNYLETMVEHVQKGVQAGESRAEVTDLEVMEGFEEFQYADWWTLSQNLDVIYQELTED
ncbi:MAG: MBL fold metallo-hydrolase [Balneolaceae bacterium]|nr:MBL fold metallo-hydrolase [Balneolaceae bacterium]